MVPDSSATSPSSSRTLHSAILRRLAIVKNTKVAEAIGKDDSAVSRIAAGHAGIHLTDLHAFLAALGLKVVDATQNTVDMEEHEAYRVLAAKLLTRSRGLDPGADEPRLSEDFEP